MDNRNPVQFNSSTRIIPETLINAKGDLIIGTGDNSVARLPAGTTGYVLVSDPSATNGVKWDIPTLSPLGVRSPLISHTLSQADAGFLIQGFNLTVTVPTNTAQPIATGSCIVLLQTGTGVFSVTASSGVTVRATPGTKLRTQFSVATLVKTDTNTWLLSGDLSA